MPVSDKIPLHSLLALLKSEGFEIGTSTMLDVQRIVANINNENIQNAGELKYLLAPVICRNKEEQQKFYKVFQQYLNTLQQQQFTLAATPVKKLKWFIGAVVILSIVASVFILLKLSPQKPAPVTLGIIELNGKQIFVIGDSVQLHVNYADSIAAEAWQTNWTFYGPGNRQQTFNNTPQVITVVDTSGNYTAVASTYDNNKELLISDTILLEVLCEQPPQVVIKSNLTDTSSGSFTAIISGTNYPLNQYNFQWTINAIPVPGDSIMTSDALLTDKANVIGLKINWPGKQLHCSKDSLITQLDIAPPVILDIKPDRNVPLTVNSNYNWSNIFMSISGLLIVPLLVAGFVYRRNIKPKPLPVNDYTSDAPGEFKGPFTIEFNSQQQRIAPDASISLLAEVLRKRHISDVTKLSVQKTIKSTIKRGGFPVLEYIPRTQPTDFLILLDKEYPDGHLSKLFGFMADRLKKEQVHLTVYTYSKEPLLLSNRSLNHVLLPIDKVARLYPGTMLLIFSNANGLFKSYDVQLKNWVADKFKSWTTKLIITPLPKNDWGKQELALYEAGFTVIPADSNAHAIITNEINQMIDRQVLKKQIVPKAYGAKKYNFNRWRQVSAYLQNAVIINNEQFNYNTNFELLEQWVCSLAIYPHIDWEVTLAVGRAIEEKYARAGHLVNFSNLLIISRIQWMNDQQLMDSLRLEMLNHLQPETEALARMVIVNMIDEIKPLISEDSLVSDEIKYIDNANKFLLNAHDAENNTLTLEELEQFKNYLTADQVDWTLSNYLEKGKNTLLKNPDRPGQTLPLNDYLKIKDVNPAAVKNKKQVHHNLKYWLKKWAPVAAFCLAFITAFLVLQFFGKLQFVHPRQYTNVTLQASDTLIPVNAVSLVTNDSLVSGTAISNNAFYFKNVPITGDSQMAFVKVTTENGMLDKEIILNHSRFIFNVIAVPFNRDTASPKNILSELPVELNEIWTVQNVYEKMAIDLKDQFLYYASSNRVPLTKIKMVEAAQMQPGIYRIILLYTATNKYEAVFLKNITQSSFEWGICNAITFNSINDARKVAEKECKQFVKASLLYTPVRRNTLSSTEYTIELPVNNLSLVASQAQQLAAAKRRVISLNKENQDNVTVSVHLNSFNKPARELLVRRAEILGAPILNNLKAGQPANRTFSGNAFQRDYIKIQISPEKISTVQPDCSRTFRSLKEALSVNPLIVCKLDLSKEYIRSIPKQVYSFTNLREINLSGNSISNDDINNFKSQFPKVIIINNNNDVKQEMQQNALPLNNYDGSSLTNISSVIRIAESQVGVQEDPPGSNRGKEIDQYNRAAGLPSGVSWNAAFVYWCYSQAAGFNPLPKSATARQMWNGLSTANKITAKEAIKNPSLIMPGNVFFINTGNAAGRVGIITGVGKNTIQTIEGNANQKGNTGESVMRMTRPISSINLGFTNFKGTPPASAK